MNSQLPPYYLLLIDLKKANTWDEKWKLHWREDDRFGLWEIDIGGIVRYPAALDTWKEGETVYTRITRLTLNEIITKFLISRYWVAAPRLKRGSMIFWDQFMPIELFRSLVDPLRFGNPLTITRLGEDWAVRSSPQEIKQALTWVDKELVSYFGLYKREAVPLLLKSLKLIPLKSVIPFQLETLKPLKQ